MRRFTLLLTGVSVAVLLGIATVDAQRPPRAQARNPAGIAQPGAGPGFQLGPMGRGARGRGWAAAPRGRGGPGGGPGLGRGRGLGAGLELTDEQRNAIQDLHLAARDESAEAADALQSAQHALHRAVFADERDDAEVAELTGQVAALRQQLADARLKTQMAVADLLTAEQKELMRTRPQGRGQGLRQGFGQGRGPGFGRGRGR